MSLNLAFWKWGQKGCKPYANLGCIVLGLRNKTLSQDRKTKDREGGREER